VPKKFHLALVTGATSGLGRALCLELARRDIALLLSGRQRDALEKLKGQLSVPCHIHEGDLTLESSLRTLIAMIHELCPDLVINNAGFGLYGEALTHSTEEQLKIIELNVKALTEITLEAARTLITKKREGTIVNISSAAGYFVYPSFNLYAASKGYVTAFSEAFDAEVAKHNVRVLTVCPGKIATNFRQRASRGLKQEKTVWSMSAEKAVRLILQQIEKGKAVQIIDWRYRLVVFLAKLLVPQKLLRRILIDSL